MSGLGNPSQQPSAANMHLFSQQQNILTQRQHQASPLQPHQLVPGITDPKNQRMLGTFWIIGIDSTLSFSFSRTHVFL